MMGQLKQKGTYFVNLQSQPYAFSPLGVGAIVVVVEAVETVVEAG